MIRQKDRTSVDPSLSGIWAQSRQVKSQLKNNKNKHKKHTHKHQY